MQINFKWEVGDVVKMPYFDNNDLVETTIVARQYLEYKNSRGIWYETDLLSDGIEFTQEQIEQHN